MFHHTLLEIDSESPAKVGLWQEHPGRLIFSFDVTMLTQSTSDRVPDMNAYRALTKCLFHMYHVKLSWYEWIIYTFSGYLDTYMPTELLANVIDTIWYLGSWWTLFYIMACCRKASSHLLNQCWLIVDWTYQRNFNQNRYFQLEKCICKCCMQNGCHCVQPSMC